MEQSLNEVYPSLWMNSDLQKTLRTHLEHGISQQISDERLLKGKTQGGSLQMIAKLMMHRLYA